MIAGERAETSYKRHLLHIYPTFAVGGAQRRFVQLGRLLADRYRHTIIALDGNFEMAPALAHAMEYRLVRVKFDKTRHLGNLPLFRRKLKRFAPDTLVTYNWGAVEWALANRWLPLARHVHVEDGFGPDERAGQFTRRIWTRRIALSAPHTRVVVPSHQLLEIAHGSWKLPERSVVYIPNGIDCEQFAPRTQGKNKTGTVVIGTLAALRPEKNVGRLIGAFGRMLSEADAPNARLLIVGGGDERGNLEQLTQRLGLQEHVEFAGATSAPETALARMDVFALTSDTEQMPLSVLEAMAVGLPIAAVGVGDVASMVAEENAPFVTPVLHDAALITSLKTLASDEGLRVRLGCANRETALERFDIHLMAARYAAVFG
ncbi:MAG TPA: glycosyltransferase family 4 protein [Rhizomicrobium sp.]|nr:glycosyltransferase family 4 protein [Rhizomicrobium sp.]